MEQAIYDACAFVADGPLRGHSRPDLTPRDLRFWTLTRYPNYTIVYRPETVPLQITAVLHGKRNLAPCSQGSEVDLQKTRSLGSGLAFSVELYLAGVDSSSIFDPFLAT